MNPRQPSSEELALRAAIALDTTAWVAAKADDPRAARTLKARADVAEALDLGVSPPPRALRWLETVALVGRPE